MVFGIDGTRGKLATFFMHYCVCSNIKCIAIDNVSDIAKVDVFVQCLARHKIDCPSDDLIDTNIIRMINICKFIKELEWSIQPKIVFISSSTVDKLLLGSLDNESRRLYAMTKLFGETLLNNSCNEVISVRLPGIIGSRSFNNFFNNALLSMISNQDISIVETGSPFVEFCSRETVSRQIVNLTGIKSRVVGGYAFGEMLLTDLLLEAKKLLSSRSKIHILNDAEPSRNILRSQTYIANMAPANAASQQEVLYSGISDMLSMS